MNLEEMAALLEQRLPPSGGLEMIQLSGYELRALVASWRERGKLLEEVRDMVKGFSFGKRLAADIDKALKAKP